MVPTDLLSGPSWICDASLPRSLYARLGDLRPRFLPKCIVGRGYRAIARNGRVLLASDAPLSELLDRLVRLRLQIWHRAILPGDVPEAFGILVDVRAAASVSGPIYGAHLIKAAEPAALALEVGGGMALGFDLVSDEC